MQSLAATVHDGSRLPWSAGATKHPRPSVVIEAVELHQHRAQVLLLLCAVLGEPVRCQVHAEAVQSTAVFLLDSSENPSPKMAGYGAR